MQCPWQLLKMVSKSMFVPGSVVYYWSLLFSTTQRLVNGYEYQENCKQRLRNYLFGEK